MPILIDNRAGSEDLILYPPFSRCPKCRAVLTITRESGPRSRIVSSECSSNPSHPTLATLCDLASICGTGRSSADVHFTGRGPNGTRVTIGVELSSYSDFISKLSSGRFQGQKSEGASQLASMIDNYDVVWVLVYGAYRPNTDNANLQTMRPLRASRGTGNRSNSTKSVSHAGYGWVDYEFRGRNIPYTYHERFLASPSLTSIPKIRAWRVWNIAEAAYWIGEVLYPLWQRAYESHDSLKVLDNSTPLPSLRPNESPETIAMASIAKELPGLRNKLAVRVARYFTTPQQMANASVEEWMSIEGIGPVRAKSIVQFWRGKVTK